MGATYDGPLRDEPIAVELHNTLYAAGGELVDGIATRTSSGAWLAALQPRLPTGGTGTGPRPEALRELRSAVRTALHAVIDGGVLPRASMDTINLTSARAPRSRVARWRTDAPPRAEWDFGPARRADVVLSALAEDAIDLITGPGRGLLRTCGAPGCVLMFVKDHPRREWCSGACGNRARQARHYLRTHHPARDRGSPATPQ